MPSSETDPKDMLQQLGVTIEPLKPSGNHHPDTRALKFTIPWGPEGAAPDIRTCLNAIQTPTGFTYSVSIMERDGPERVARDANIAEPHGDVAANMGRAIELAIANVTRDLLEAEGYRAAEAQTEAHPSEEFTMEESSRLTKSIHVDLPIEQIIVNMFPLEWDFET